MRHNLSFWDTGMEYVRYYSSERHRNDGATFSLCFGGLALLVIGSMTAGIGWYDSHSFSALCIGWLMIWAAVLDGILFVTHRNWGLSADAVRALDALYSLPKSERADYKVKREDVSMMTTGQVDAMVAAVGTYKKNLAQQGPVGNLIDALKQYNATAEEMRKEREKAEADYEKLRKDRNGDW